MYTEVENSVLFFLAYEFYILENSNNIQKQQSFYYKNSLNKKYFSKKAFYMHKKLIKYSKGKKIRLFIKSLVVNIFY